MPLTPDAWLAERLARPVFRLTGDPPGALPAGLVYAKADIDDVAGVARLETAGFHVISTAVTFERELPLPGAAQGAHCRGATPGDQEAVARVARHSFTYDRFHVDPAIPAPMADGVKEAWARGFFSGTRGHRMVVAEASARVAGFLLLLEDGDRIVVDLVAVDAEARGRGRARAMMAHASAGAAARVMAVGTQVANRPSIRLYESMGFRLSAAQYVLHRHA